MTVSLGTLWSSIKQDKAPYMFDGEHGIVVHPMQLNRASSHGDGEVSWFCSSCGGNTGYILELWRGKSFKARVCSATSGFLPSYEDISGISLRLGRAIRTLLEVMRETKVPFPVATGIFGFLSIFKKSQASSPFKALNSACL